jgi:hypothetical protein
MILKYFRRNIWQKYWEFFAQTTPSLKKIIDNIGCWENWQKSQKIVIINIDPFS